MRTLIILFFLLPVVAAGQAKLSWQNVDLLYGPLPPSVHVFRTTDRVDTAPFRAFYVIADLKDKKLAFTTDTTLNRRLTPSQFYEKNKAPFIVVNGTFFSFETNRNLNMVIRDGELVSHNQHIVRGRGKDSLTYRHPFASAIGISKKRKADIAWTITDSGSREVFASQIALAPLKDSVEKHDQSFFIQAVSGSNKTKPGPLFEKWKMKTAIGGGPVLVQNSEVLITNNEELKFAGKAINDKHPRTAMGYTSDNKLVILVIEGRSKEAGGASLIQQAQILKDLGCVEALNLDGGGSSCLLVNGKETIKPSDPKGQRPVPAVFIIGKE